MVEKALDVNLSRKGERGEFFEKLEKSMKVLGKAWRDLLKNPDAALGIDTEFTRPGIEALLGQLETVFEQCEPTSEFEFKWR